MMFTKQLIENKSVYKYFEEELMKGWPIWRALISKIPHGQVYSWLPEEINANELDRFGESISFLFGKSVGSENFIHFLERINTHLALSGNSIVLFHTLVSQNNPFIQTKKIPFISLEGKVYFYLTDADLEYETTRNAIKFSGSYPYISIFSTTSGNGLEPGADLSEEVFREILAASSVIVIGAFDDEGFLFWEEQK